MKDWLLKFLHSLRHEESGFTLIELLVVVAILGSLTGIVMVNVGGFIGSGREEARDAEGSQVQTAAMCYMAEGNTISESFTVGPEGQGVLDKYLIGNLSYSWTIDVNGAVNPDEDEESDPEPDPEPGKKPDKKPDYKPKPQPAQPWWH